MRRVARFLLEAFRYGAALTLIGYLVWTASGFFQGDIGGTVLRLAAGVGVFLVASVVYAAAMHLLAPAAADPESGSSVKARILEIIDGATRPSIETAELMRGASDLPAWRADAMAWPSHAARELARLMLDHADSPLLHMKHRDVRSPDAPRTAAMNLSLDLHRPLRLALGDVRFHQVMDDLYGPLPVQREAAERNLQAADEAVREDREDSTFAAWVARRFFIYLAGSSKALQYRESDVVYRVAPAVGKRLDELVADLARHLPNEAPELRWKGAHG